MPFAKYLNLFGNPIRGTDTIKTYINKYEQQPFDGILFNPKFTHGQISVAQPLSVWNWSGYAVDWASLASSISDYDTTAFRRFSQNYVLLKTSVLEPYGIADWYSPEMRAVIWNARCAAAFSKRVPFCRGVFFDPEPENGTAGRELFNYSDRPFASDYTFAQYQARAKYWGRLFVEAMQEERSDIKIYIAFGYEQAVKNSSPPGESDNYGLYAAFLDGMFDALTGAAQIRNFNEDGYAHYLAADFQATRDAFENPDSTVFGTKRYHGRALYSNASRQESLSDANLKTGVILGIEDFVDQDAWVYNETATPFLGATGTPTQTAATIAALHEARVEVGFQNAFDPAVIPGLIGDMNPSEVVAAGGANNDPITSYTDSTGLVYAQAGGLRPILQTNGIATGIPSFLFAVGSTQYLVITGLLARLVGTSDIPMSVFMLLKPTSVAASQGFLSIGRSATTDAQRVFGASTAALRHKIKDDAGGNTTTTGTVTITTNAQVASYIDSGTVLNMRHDGANTITTNPYVTNDYGTSTFDRAWVGAECLNTPINYASCHIGRILIYNRPILKDAIHWIEYNLGTPAGVVVAGA